MHIPKGKRIPSAMRGYIFHTKERKDTGTKHTKLPFPYNPYTAIPKAVISMPNTVNCMNLPL